MNRIEKNTLVTRGFELMFIERRAEIFKVDPQNFPDGSKTAGKGLAFGQPGQLYTGPLRGGGAKPPKIFQGGAKSGCRRLNSMYEHDAYHFLFLKTQLFKRGPKKQQFHANCQPTFWRVKFFIKSLSMQGKFKFCQLILWKKSSGPFNMSLPRDWSRFSLRLYMIGWL